MAESGVSFNSSLPCFGWATKPWCEPCPACLKPASSACWLPSCISSPPSHETWEKNKFRGSYQQSEFTRCQLHNPQSDPDRCPAFQMWWFSLIRLTAITLSCQINDLINSSTRANYQNPHYIQCEVGKPPKPYPKEGRKNSFIVPHQGWPFIAHTITEGRVGWANCEEWGSLRTEQSKDPDFL